MATSYNGWPASPDPAEIDVQPFAAGPISFPSGVRGGDVAKVLGYLVTNLHYRVEPAVPGWGWGYTYKANVNNPSTLSCHASATAVDWNAPDHANGAHGTWTAEQESEVRKILDELGGAVQWGEDYTGTVDGMHFELIVDAATLAGIAANLPDTNPPEDDDVTDDDIEAIADAVIDKLRSEKIVAYNKTDRGTGKETNVTDSIVGALGSAATYAGRSAYSAHEADEQTE